MDHSERPLGSLVVVVVVVAGRLVEGVSDLDPTFSQRLRHGFTELRLQRLSRSGDFARIESVCFVPGHLRVVCPGPTPNPLFQRPVGRWS